MTAAAPSLAAEGAWHAIWANCISPGMIRTPDTEADLLAEDHPSTRSPGHPARPHRRTGGGRRCALFLATYVTGANLVVDGAWSAVPPGTSEHRRRESKV